MALPISPPATAPTTAPATGLRRASRPPVTPPAMAPMPVPIACREPGGPQPATRLAAAATRIKVFTHDRDVMALPGASQSALIGICRGGCVAHRSPPGGIAAAHRGRAALRRWSMLRAQDRYG